VAAAVDGMGNLINTTVSNCYDYWFTASNVASANAQVHTDTRGVGAGLSDHAGVTLRLPYL
jgi:endonuclease/exonuclease/phosphatase family metal-dependent hydrolase